MKSAIIEHIAEMQSTDNIAHLELFEEFVCRIASRIMEDACDY